MPNPGSDAPLRKVTLNLYEADCQWLEYTYGHGWSTMVRDTIQRECNHLRQLRTGYQRQTLGDLE